MNWPTFDPNSPEQWYQQIIKELKTGSFEELKYLTEEGITINPFYTKADLPDPLLEQLQKTQKQSPGFEIVEIIKAEGNNILSRVQEARQGGIEKVLIVVQENDLSSVEILKSTPELPFLFYTQKANVFTELLQQFPTSEIYFDPLIAFISNNNKAASSLFTYTSLTIDTTHFHQAGANMSQELACVLSVLVEQLNRTAGSVESIKNLTVVTSVTSRYLAEITKLRAARWLIYKVLQEYNLCLEVYIHGLDSPRYKPQQDAYNNMIRSTLEAMAMAIGGADRITIQAFDAQFSTTDEFSRRVARNIPLVLRHESHLGQVLDAAAGSYFLESFTIELAQTAWQSFQEIQALGGFLAAWQQGFIQNQIQENKKQREQAYSEKKKILVGVNAFEPKASK